MKITRRQLKKVINESMKGFRDPTDDPRFSDPSYSGYPGSYTYMGDDIGGPRQTGISIEMAFYNASHPLFRGTTTGLFGDIEFSDYGADSVDDLTDQQYEKVMADAMAIIEHPASRLEENEREDAEQDLIGAMQGDTNTGTYFYPKFDDTDDLIDRDPIPDMYGPGGRYDPDIDSHGYGRGK